jgi:hypothetical protein
MKRISSILYSVTLAVAALGYAAPALGRAKITIVNTNVPGVGFNDPTPAAPIGGNSGTTIGQQRLLAVQHAANLWGEAIDSQVEIFVQASFAPLSCTASSGLASTTRPASVLVNFAGAEQQDTWYPVALANKWAGTDLFPPMISLGMKGHDIVSVFNVNLGQPDCMTGGYFYYGLDGRAPQSRIDLVTTALHEFGHGLGFATQANGMTGAYLDGTPDVLAHHIYDNTLRKTWAEMTDAERRASATHTRQVVWTGPEVTAAVPHLLAAGVPKLTIEAPSSIAGDYSVGLAFFGPQLDAQGVRGAVVAALDASDSAGPSLSDACSTILNPEEVAGHIAFVDRGTCPFINKVRNVQNAGAIAVLIADNAPGDPPLHITGNGGGSDITIPAVRITRAAGTTLRSQLAAGVQARLGIRLDRYAGADANGRMYLYTPNPFESASSINHWDIIASPSQLMEPFITADFTHDLGLTVPLMHDIGWFPDSDVDGIANAEDQCPNTDTSLSTVVIQGCDSGVPNTLFKTGCTVLDLVKRCAVGVNDHGGYVSCVSHLTNDLKKQDLISGSQKGAMQSCASQAPTP